MVVALLRHARAAKPGFREAEALTGLRVVTVDGAVRAAEAIARRGVENVVVKGGRLKPEIGKMVDILSRARKDRKPAPPSLIR